MTAAARAVAVFCGSRTGDDPSFLAATVALGRGLAARQVTLVYGGGCIGLMGALADTVLHGGGRVIGVIPDFLRQREVAHPGLTELHVTDSMHSRKQLMFRLADAFVTMPGGFGTLDETFEVLSWKQLDLHAKPVLVCNVNGWADPLLGTLRLTAKQGFAAAASLNLFEVVADVPSLLLRLDRVAHQEAGAALL